MSKDKEFKAKNRDLNFSIPQKDDTVLGRQNRPEEHKTDLSSSKKNRMYQQRQEATEQPADITETKTGISQNSVSDTVINNTENPVYEHNAFDTKETIPEHSEQPKTAESVKGTQRKQTEKFRADNDASVPDEKAVAETPFEKSEPVSPAEMKDIQAEMPPPAPKGERYNIQDAMHENKQAFDIVEKNTDFKLGRQEHTASKGTQEKKGIKPKNKNRLYQKEHAKAMKRYRQLLQKMLQMLKVQNPIQPTQQKAAKLLTRKFLCKRIFNLTVPKNMRSAPKSSTKEQIRQEIKLLIIQKSKSSVFMMKKSIKAKTACSLKKKQSRKATTDIPLLKTPLPLQVTRFY